MRCYRQRVQPLVTERGTGRNFAPPTQGSECAYLTSECYDKSAIHPQTHAHKRNLEKTQHE